jgi:hypothetical protein
MSDFHASEHRPRKQGQPTHTRESGFQKRRRISQKQLRKRSMAGRVSLQHPQRRMERTKNTDKDNLRNRDKTLSQPPKITLNVASRSHLAFSMLLYSLSNAIIVGLLGCHTIGIHCVLFHQALFLPKEILPLHRHILDLGQDPKTQSSRDLLSLQPSFLCLFPQLPLCTEPPLEFPLLPCRPSQVARTHSFQEAFSEADIL